MAYPAADAGKGVVLLKQFQGFPVFTFIDQGNVTLNADMGRAGSLAGSGAEFADAEGPWNRLRVLLEDRFAFGQAFVILIGQGDGTNRGALTATGAFCQVDEAGLLVDSCGEVSRSTF